MQTDTAFIAMLDHPKDEAAELVRVFGHYRNVGTFFKDRSDAYPTMWYIVEVAIRYEDQPGSENYVKKRGWKMAYHSLFDEL